MMENNYIPQVGDIKRAKEIGYHGRRKFIYQACQFCGVERWVAIENGQPVSHQCRKCSRKGESWDGNTHKGSFGYILVYVSPNDFFYPMCNNNGYVMEHRLVMARHLGRCLHRWEVVHHKNHIKDDNRIENLQLFSDTRHNQITILENRVSQLESRVTQLEAENILLKSQTVMSSLQ